MRTAIIAALPRELRLLTRGWAPSQGNARGVLALRKGAVIAVCAGMGADRVAVAVETALRHTPVDRLVSFGLAGGCDPQVPAGSVQLCSSVIEARSGERFDAYPLTDRSTTVGVLVSTPAVAGVREKQRLHATYGASIVDMEAATVGRLARAHGLVFSACKAVSDDAATEIAGLGQFTGRLGEFREAAFAAHLVLRPKLWPLVAALSRNSSHALRDLTNVVVRDLHLYEPRQHGLPS